MTSRVLCACASVAPPKSQGLCSIVLFNIPPSLGWGEPQSDKPAPQPGSTTTRRDRSFTMSGMGSIFRLCGGKRAERRGRGETKLFNDCEHHTVLLDQAAYLDPGAGASEGVEGVLTASASCSPFLLCGGWELPHPPVGRVQR